MNDEQFMLEALHEAELAFQEGEVPVGAVVVKDEKIIGRGHNKRETNLDISGHAEIEAMRDASRRLGTWNLEGCTLFVTLEPCLMCSGAILQSGIFRLVYGADDEKMGAICSAFHVYDAPIKEKRPLVSRGVLKEEASRLLVNFFEKLR